MKEFLNKKRIFYSYYELLIPKKKRFILPNQETPIKSSNKKIQFFQKIQHKDILIYLFQFLNPIEILNLYFTFPKSNFKEKLKNILNFYINSIINISPNSIETYNFFSSIKINNLDSKNILYEFFTHLNKKTKLNRNFYFIQYYKEIKEIIKLRFKNLTIGENEFTFDDNLFITHFQYIPEFDKNKIILYDINYFIIYDLENKKIEKKLKIYSDYTFYNKNLNKFIIPSTNNGNLFIYDILKNELTEEKIFNNNIQIVEIKNNKKYENCFALFSDNFRDKNMIIIYNIKELKKYNLFNYNLNIKFLFCSDNGKYLIYVNQDNICYYSLEKEKTILKYNFNNLNFTFLTKIDNFVKNSNSFLLLKNNQLNIITIENNNNFFNTSIPINIKEEIILNPNSVIVCESFKKNNNLILKIYICQDFSCVKLLKIIKKYKFKFSI
jgi:hypothetical protein